MTTKEKTEDLLKNLQKLNSSISFKSASKASKGSDSDSGSDTDHYNSKDNSSESEGEEESSNRSILEKLKNSSISLTKSSGSDKQIRGNETTTIKVKTFQSKKLHTCSFCQAQFDEQSKLVKHIPNCYKVSQASLKDNSESESDYDSNDSGASDENINLGSGVSISSRSSVKINPNKLPPGIHVSSLNKQISLKSKSEEGNETNALKSEENFQENISKLPIGISVATKNNCERPLKAEEKLPTQRNLQSIKSANEQQKLNLEKPSTLPSNSLSENTTQKNQKPLPQQSFQRLKPQSEKLSESESSVNQEDSHSQIYKTDQDSSTLVSKPEPKKRGRKRGSTVGKYKPSPLSKKRKRERSQSPDYVPSGRVGKRNLVKNFEETESEDFNSIVSVPERRSRTSTPNPREESSTLICTRKKADFTGFYYELEYPDSPESPDFPLRTSAPVAKKSTSKSKKTLPFVGGCVSCSIDNFSSESEFEDHHILHINCTKLFVKVERSCDSPSLSLEGSNSRSSTPTEPKDIDEGGSSLKLKLKLSEVVNFGKVTKKKFTILNEQESNSLVNTKVSLNEPEQKIKKSSSPPPPFVKIHAEPSPIADVKVHSLADIKIKTSEIQESPPLPSEDEVEICKEVNPPVEPVNDITVEVAKVEKRESSPVPTENKVLPTKKEETPSVENKATESSVSSNNNLIVVADVHQPSQPNMTLRGTPSPSVTPQAANSPMGHQFSPNTPQNPSPVPVSIQSRLPQEDTSFQSIIPMNEDQPIPTSTMHNQDNSMIPPSMDQSTVGTSNAPTLTPLQTTNQFNAFPNQNMPVAPTFDAPSSYEPQFESLTSDWMNDYESTGQRIAAAMSGNTNNQGHTNQYMPGNENGQGSFEQLCINDTYSNGTMPIQNNVPAYGSNAGSGIFPDNNYNVNREGQNSQQAFNNSNSTSQNTEINSHSPSPHGSSPIPIPQQDPLGDVTTPRITVSNNLMPTTSASETENSLLPAYSQSWPHNTSQPFPQNAFQNSMRPPLRPGIPNLPVNYRPSPRPRVRGRPPLVDNIPNMYRQRQPTIQPRGRGRGMSQTYPMRSPVPQKRGALNQGNTTSPLKNVRRGDINVPSRQKDNDCQIIAVANRNEGMPVIANVQGNTRDEQRSRVTAPVSDSTIHLNDSITLSVRQNTQKEQPKTAKSGDAGVVANLLASRGITVTPAASEKEGTVNAERRLPTATDLNLSSAISVHPPASNRDRDGFAVPAPPGRTPTVNNDVDRPPRPPTVDLTQESKCSQCDKVFPNQALLADHTKVHQQQEKSRMPFKCHLCNAGFSSQKTQQSHYQQFHQIHLSASDLAIPVVDFRNQATQRKMQQLGVRGFIPLSNLQNRGAGGVVGIPILSLESVNQGHSMSIQQWGITDVLSLGPPKALQSSQQQRTPPTSPIRNMTRPMQ